MRCDRERSPQLNEYPISWYSTTDPGEDFAESLTAFLKSPRLLKNRSPRRQPLSCTQDTGRFAQLAVDVLTMQ